MQSFQEEYLNKLIIPHPVIRIISQISEYKGKQELYKRQKPEALENLRKVAVIQSTESSNRIEGITADIKRIKALIEEKTTPENRSESEIAGYRDVLGIIHESYQDIPFNNNVTLQFHRNLMKYSGKEGGRWKSGNNDITETLADGSQIIRFKPVDAFNTPNFMEQLNKNFNFFVNKQEFDPLILIALYILDFLCVHPFLDGNGRMARLITVLLLYQNNYEVGKYISLERIIENTKKSYYETLEASSQGWHDGNHNSLPWIEYFLSTILAAYVEFESRVGNISDKSISSSQGGNKTEIILNAIDNFIGNFSLSDIFEVSPNVSEELIKKVLKKLNKEGKIEPISKGRYAKWRKI